MSKHLHFETNAQYLVYWADEGKRIAVIPAFNGKAEAGHRTWSLKCKCHPTYGDEMFQLNVTRKGVVAPETFGPAPTVFHKRINPVMIDQPNGESIPVW